MKQEALRYLMFGLSVLVVGPVIGWMVSQTPSLDGGPAATGLITPNVTLGMGATLLAVALTGVWGLLAGVVVRPRDGLVCFGAALAFGAWSQGRMDDLVRAGADAGLWRAFVIEGLAAGLLAAALAALGQHLTRRQRPEETEPVASPWTLLAGAAYVPAALLGAWLIARHEAVGQVFTAAIVAGIAGGVAGRVVAPHGSIIGLLIGLAAVAALGPAIGSLGLEPDFERQIFSGHAPGLLRIPPLAWVSGQLVGLPLGTALAVSLVEHAHVVESHGSGASKRSV